MFNHRYLYACVYDNGTCKIGVTNNADKRLRELNGASPIKITEFLYRECDADYAEEIFHEAFKSKRVKHEFFQLTREEIEKVMMMDIPDRYPDIQLGASGYWLKKKIEANRKRNDDRDRTNHPHAH